MKHLDLKVLAAQQHVAEGTVKLSYYPSGDALADLLTKHLPSQQFVLQSERLGLMDTTEGGDIMAIEEEPKETPSSSSTGPDPVLLCPVCSRCIDRQQPRAQCQTCLKSVHYGRGMYCRLCLKYECRTCRKSHSHRLLNCVVCTYGIINKQNKVTCRQCLSTVHWKCAEKHPSGQHWCRACLREQEEIDERLDRRERSPAPLRSRSREGLMKVEDRDLGACLVCGVRLRESHGLLSCDQCSRRVHQRCATECADCTWRICTNCSRSHRCEQESVVMVIEAVEQLGEQAVEQLGGQAAWKPWQLIVVTCMVAQCLQLCGWMWRVVRACTRRRTKSVREVATQSQVTYRSGRFVPLPESRQGCFIGESVLQM
jgi:hypothetical protein